MCVGARVHTHFERESGGRNPLERNIKRKENFVSKSVKYVKQKRESAVGITTI